MVVPSKNAPIQNNAAPIGMNKLNRDDNQFNRVMDWGTPRLVTKNR